MSLGLGAGEADRKRGQIKPLERELRRPGCGDGWRNDRRQRSHAADTGFKADRAVALVRAGCWPSLGDVAVANDATSTVNRVGRRLGGAKACNQAGERNRVSGDERDNALPKWPLRECHAHNTVSPPFDRYKQLTGKEIPSPAVKPRKSPGSH